MSQDTRVAVVTGGTQGIGRRTAELLSERGYRLAIIDLHHPAETAHAIEARGHEVLAHTGDITDEDAVPASPGKSWRDSAASTCW
jgi:NAD(P)-dependent dehydrogenase (short-subunit alcohol dehydrogenase family)